MNLLTLADARSLCAPVAQAGGACSSTPLLDRRINEAVRRLVRMADVPEQTAVLHVLVEGNTITLPREVKTVLGLANFNLDPMRLRHIGYELSTSGPGELAECQCSPVSLIAEPGLYPTFFPLPKGRELKLAAFTRNREATATSMRVLGRKMNGEQLWSNDRAGEDLTISVWQGGTEGDILWNNLHLSTAIDQVENLVIPARQGYLTLLAIDDSTYETYFLGKYHPEDTHPGFRRYRLRGADCCDSNCVSLFVKLHTPKVSYPDDPLPIQNVDAIKQMIMAINAENTGDQQRAVNFQAMAKALVVSEIADGHGGEEVMLQIKDDYAYGGDALSLNL